MTSTVHYTILLFIYRGISGGSVVFSFDDLKFLFVLFPFGLWHEELPTFASDFSKNFLGNCAAGVVVYGSVMFLANNA